METFDIRFLQEALDDLEEIVCYIAQENRAAALKMHDRIIEKAHDLSTFPKRGRYVADAKMREAGYRTLLIKPYIAFYRAIGRYVFIYRVIHGATNYPLLYEKMQQVADNEDIK
jgi:plasmid stabilization system protein ParE